MRNGNDQSKRGEISRYLLGVLFISMGILHFVLSTFFVQIVPPFLPRPDLLVAISGVCEIFGGVGIFVHFVQKKAGWGLIALLIAVYPANIYMLAHQIQTQGWTLFSLALILRLPLQFVLIAWVYRAVLAPKLARL